MNLVGIAILAALALGFLFITKRTWRLAARTTPGRRRRLRMGACLSVLGLALGFWGGIFSINWGESTTLGVPLPVAAFAPVHPGGRHVDFVSSPSVLMFFFDVLFWLGLVYLPTWLVLRSLARRPAAPPRASSADSISAG